MTVLTAPTRPSIDADPRALVAVVEPRVQHRVPEPPTPSPLSGRDRAVLRAVAAGRCVFVDGGGALTIDSVRCCDQFVGARLTGAGLITGVGAVCLTAAGQDLLAAG